MIYCIYRLFVMIIKIIYIPKQYISCNRLYMCSIIYSVSGMLSWLQNERRCFVTKLVSYTVALKTFKIKSFIILPTKDYQNEEKSETIDWYSQKEKTATIRRFVIYLKFIFCNHSEIHLSSKVGIYK